MVKNQMFTNYPDVMSVKQVQEALSISRLGVYKLLRAGEIKSFMIGNTYKIPKTVLIEYVMKNTKI